MPILRRAAISLCATAVIWLLACGAIGIVAVEGALHPFRTMLRQDDWLHARLIAERNHAMFRQVEIRASDGTLLSAWSLRPQTGSPDAVILLHGQGDGRAGMLSNADLLLRHGYAVLLPDARAQGNSGGAIATYGVLESDDLQRWFAWLQQDQHPHCIDALGDSMGAAQVLESLAHVHGYCAVVAESPFAAFREAAYDRMGQQFGTGPWLGRTVLRPAVETGLLYARMRYGVNLAHASPLHAIQQSRTPVLLIHGLADTNLPPRHSEALAKADTSAQLWEPKNAEP